MTSNLRFIEPDDRTGSYYVNRVAERMMRKPDWNLIKGRFGGDRAKYEACVVAVFGKGEQCERKVA